MELNSKTCMLKLFDEYKLRQQLLERIKKPE